MIAIGAFVRFLCAAALYLAWAGSLSLAEGAAAVLSGVSGAAFALLLRNRGERRFSPAAPWPLLLARLGWAVARDSALVGAQLARSLFTPIRGGIGDQPFVAAGGNRVGRGRRALAVLLASAAPNGIVVACASRSLAVHRLLPRPAAADRKWPI